jgi:hypothetical protein
MSPSSTFTAGLHCNKVRARMRHRASVLSVGAAASPCPSVCVCVCMCACAGASIEQLEAAQARMGAQLPFEVRVPAARCQQAPALQPNSRSHSAASGPHRRCGVRSVLPVVFPVPCLLWWPGVGAIPLQSGPGAWNSRHVCWRVPPVR